MDTACFCRSGERADRRRWREEGGERVAAVEKIEEKRKPEDFFGHRNRRAKGAAAPEGALALGSDHLLRVEDGIKLLSSHKTQCEQVTMVAVQVMANDVAVSMSASQGNFELNVFMPVCIYNFLQSARLLSDSIDSFNRNCAVGIAANRQQMHRSLHNSLMLVTALSPYIGYENAARTAKLAFAENISLKQACLTLGFMTAQQFDAVFHPEQMI